jgi:hypothetical protein
LGQDCALWVSTVLKTVSILCQPKKVLSQEILVLLSRHSVHLGPSSSKTSRLPAWVVLVVTNASKEAPSSLPSAQLATTDLLLNPTFVVSVQRGLFRTNGELKTFWNAKSVHPVEFAKLKVFQI